MSVDVQTTETILTKGKQNLYFRDKKLFMINFENQPLFCLKPPQK